MATNKTNIFEILKQIDNKNISFCDEALKSSQPFMLMKWLSGTKKKDQVKLINDLVNSTVFNFYNHPKLLYYLLIASSDGQSKRYKFYKTKTNKSIDVKIISEYYEMTSIEAVGETDRFSKKELIEMAKSLGYDKDTIKKIK